MCYLRPAAVNVNQLILNLISFFCTNVINVSCKPDDVFCIIIIGNYTDNENYPFIYICAIYCKRYFVKQKIHKHIKTWPSDVSNYDDVSDCTCVNKHVLEILELILDSLQKNALVKSPENSYLYLFMIVRVYIPNVTFLKPFF